MNRFCNFSGRIGRGEYLTCFFSHLAFFVLTCGGMIFAGLKSEDAVPVIMTLFVIQGFSLLSLTIRRAHDIGRTTRWVIFSMLSMVGIGIIVLMCLVMGSDSSENEYGLPADQMTKNQIPSIGSRGRFDRD